MSKKEVLIAVIGGVIGAVLTMAAGLFAPLAAQNEVRDAEFGAITCKSISVKDKPGAGGVLVRVGEDGGEIIVLGKNGGLLGITGSTLLIQSGEIRVMDKQSTAAAVIKGYEDLVAMGIVGRDDKHRVLIGNNEDGGAVVVQSDDGSGQAAMGISRGGGIVTTRDKNGNHSWASIGN